MLSLGIALLTVYALAGPAVHGVVRASDTAEPIPGVLLEVTDQRRMTWTDSAGRYTLPDLPSGPHELRISRPGYVARVFEVFLASDSALRLDITLLRRPWTLNAIRVSARREGGAGDAVSDGLTLGRAAIGARRFADGDLHANPAFGDADVLQTLAISPDVVTRPELSTTLHVRGGSGDQNLILLDGVPLYNPYHMAGALTAINPDVVSAITMNAGAPSARYGGALASVISIETLNPDVAHVRSRGAFSSRAVRQTLDGPLPGGFARFALSGRRSMRDLIGSGGNRTNSSAAFGDLFAKAALRVGDGELSVFSFTSSDRLAFDAQGELAGDGIQSIGGEGLESGLPAPTPGGAPQNGVDWRTNTQAITWRNAQHDSFEMHARAWRTRFDANALWAATSGPVHLASTLNSIGLGVDISRRSASSVITAGIGTERIRTDYALDRIDVLDRTATLPPTLRSSPSLFSLFLENQWSVSRHWTVTVGARDQLGLGQWRDIEPRVSVRFAPSTQVALSAGYARTHQVVQSLRNEESLLDAVVGVGLPVAAGTGVVPIASSDELTFSADAQVGAGTTLSLGGYSRRLDGLVLVAPATSQPFAVGSFSRGTGRASGLTLLLARRGERLFGHASYALVFAERSVAGARYRPSFASTHAFNVAVGYRPRPGTVLRAALWTSAGRPANLVDGAVQWAPYGLLGGAEEMAGSPQRIVGALNGEWLAVYARGDVGIRQSWRPALLGRFADLTAILNVTNILDRANVLGTALLSDRRTRFDMPMAPRSLSLGLEWCP